MPRPPLHPSSHHHDLVPAWTRASSVRHLRNGLIFLFVVCLFAVVGYVLVGWTWLEAIYMAVITVFTVGYGEPVPVESPGVRIFTIFFILLGCTGYLYIGSALVQFLVEGHIENLLGKRRMGKSIHNLKNHTIVCGYGRVGRMLSEELHSAGHDFVIIDRDETQVTSIHEKGFLFLQEDATEEESLVEAGIGRAKQIAVVLADDAANVFITLSARNLNENVNIIARGMAPTTVGKVRYLR